MRERLQTCMLEQDEDGDIVFARGSYRMFVSRNEIEQVIKFLQLAKEKNANKT